MLLLAAKARIFTTVSGYFTYIILFFCSMCICKKKLWGFLSKTICIIPLELTFAFRKIFGNSHLGIRKLKIERIKTYVRFFFIVFTRYGKHLKIYVRLLSVSKIQSSFKNKSCNHFKINNNINVDVLDAIMSCLMF